MTARDLDQLSIGAVCVGALTAASFFTFTVDDAFIVFRYARNLVTEGQLAFNFGEHVMAFTSPMHAMLTAIMVAVSDAYALQLNKIAMILLVSVSAWLLIRRGRNDPRRRVLVLTMLVASPFVWMWAVGGLETMLVMCVITVFALLYKHADEPNVFLTMNTLAGVIFLARYDTVFFVLPVLGGIWWQTWRREGVGTLAKGMGLSAALPVAWLAFSVYYFHDIFPTSFYAKATRDISLFKILYMGQFLLVTGVLPLWLLALARVWHRGQGHSLKAFVKAHGPLLVGLALVFAYGSAHATVHMMFGYRLLLPYLPVLILLGIELLGVADTGRPAQVWRNRGVAVLAGMLLLLQVGQAAVVYSRSLGGIGITGEFHAMGLSSYRSVFLPVMELGCRDLVAHAATIRRFETRAPRFSTFAEGYIPYCEAPLYVYGHLVSYRRSVNESWPAKPAFQRSADYIYVLAPRHGSVAKQLPLPVEQYEPVSSHTIEYDGQDETFAIYFNPNPDNAHLPTHVR